MRFYLRFIIKDIADEERVHACEFLKLLKELAPDEKKSYDEGAEILELVRYANVHNQKPLVEDELRFIAKYPEITQKIFTMTP